MTIREIQELIKFMDEKQGGRNADCGLKSIAGAGVRYDVCSRFSEAVRDANAAGIDLTEAMVEWLGQKK